MHIKQSVVMTDNLIQMLKRIFILSVLIFGLNSGCKKSSTTTNTGVPNVSVNFTIDTYLPQYNNLTVIGGWMYVSGGYLNHGLIIYRASSSQFYAMDRTCTYNNAGVVQVLKNGIMSVDSSCGSQFTITTAGSVSKGPAGLSLKNYQTSFDGEYLTVMN